MSYTVPISIIERLRYTEPLSHTVPLSITEAMPNTDPFLQEHLGDG